jgi:hypothetical protein
VIRGVQYASFEYDVSCSFGGVEVSAHFTKDSTLVCQTHSLPPKFYENLTLRVFDLEYRLGTSLTVLSTSYLVKDSKITFDSEEVGTEG